MISFYCFVICVKKIEKSASVIYKSYSISVNRGTSDFGYLLFLPVSYEDDSENDSLLICSKSMGFITGFSNADFFNNSCCYSKNLIYS